MSAPVVNIPPPLLPELPLPPDSYDVHRDAQTPLIIDNGSTHLRWGFATSSTPRWGTNLVSKYKERRHNRPLVLFGDAVDVESGARAQSRAAWEGDILLNFDALENALDYAFVSLGVDGNGVNHPILMSERLSNPLHSRGLTSELMFELYSVPSLSYCVDGIMSFYKNNGLSDGLSISFNTASTSVIPILGGKGIMSCAKRIPWGALQASDYLLKLLQLKYPTFPSRVTPFHTNWILQNHCDVASDYPALLRSLADPPTLKSSNVIVQFPYVPAAVDERSEEQLAKLAEKRKEQGRKLQEMAARNRIEKLQQKETDLQNLTALRDSRAGETRREWEAILEDEGFEDDQDLDDAIRKLDADIKKSRKKDAPDEDEMIPDFPYADIPDERLDEDGLKEKKKQRLLRAGYEARVRARREKEREREERVAEEKQEELERESDLGSWSQKLRQEQEALIAKIRERERRRTALSDRKSAAAQARMKNIANLATDERVPKKRKAGGEDSFGADDADWAIYRKINTDAPSDDEEDDLARLSTIEDKLLLHDPTFSLEETHAALSNQRSALLSAFKPTYPDTDMEGSMRIHLSTERWRVCETWFSPGMAGIDSAGLGEVIQNVVSRFDANDQARLVQNIFLTGSPSKFPGLPVRLQNTLRPLLPQEMPIGIRRADDATLDAWRGMAKFSLTNEFKQTGMSRAEYNEHGPERVKKWWGSNWNYALEC
ncbi:chromatin remodeling complex subunit [Cylindrobasidium torrendii FP15055 ss-10]|uniref:Chromatin remodeling complex subunit n=1 Tax=Cylindrobasidium torrendii FP15055 ss-10 TaxID=1314674 RepID=A0A0D7B1U6_9AGAR|nr:chromatin remodeling complex subunit [Cylindrobasidium torrendii FP15055 ss-10]